MLIAPILALIAYFGVDYMVAERPHAAQSGTSYPLVAKSNCRWTSGLCTLENADVELNLSQAADGALAVVSTIPLDGIVYSLGSGQVDYSQPTRMEQVDAKNFRLSLPATATDLSELELRLVASSAGTQFFVATNLTFLAPDPY